MEKIKINLVDNPSQVYQEIEVDDYNDNMKLVPLGINPFKYFRKPTNYLINNAKILGISNLILNNFNLGAINNIVFNVKNTDKIFHNSEKYIEYVEKKLFFTVVNEENIEKGIFLGSHWNYGHWLFNHLARLYYCQKTFMKQKIIVNNSINNNQFQILKYFNISEKNIKIIKSGTMLKVDELIIPQMPWHALNGQMWWAPNSFDFIRNHLGSNQASINDAKKNIFITRSTARWRRVINEDRLFNIAKKYDFTLVDIGTLTVDEQLNLGKQTKNLISPFGANSNFFINLPTGSKFIELAPPTNQMGVGGPMAIASGIKYLRINGKPEDKRNPDNIDANYTVNENEFLDKMVSFFNLNQ